MLSARRLAHTATKVSPPNISMAAANRLSTVHRHLSSSSASGGQGGDGQVKHLTVFGAGLMGAGIAQVGAQSGLKVRLLSLLGRCAEPHEVRSSSRT